MFKEWFEAIKYYPEIKRQLEDTKADLVNAQTLAGSALDKYNSLRDSLNPPSIDSADFWNNKWKQSVIFYSAPTRKKLTEYLAYHPIEQISLIADQIIDDAGIVNPDDVPLAVMKWVQAQFKASKFKYRLDQGETWEDPESSLKQPYFDCDGIGIVEYFLIRELFMQLGLWHAVQHRLKCVMGHVHEASQNNPYAGFHFYLIWLHSSGEFHTVESTFYRERAILNYGVKRHKDNPQYGLIVATFNDTYMFAQKDLDLKKEDLIWQVK